MAPRRIGIYVEDAQAFSRESRKLTTSRGASPSLFDQLLSRNELVLPIYRFSRVARLHRLYIYVSIPGPSMVFSALTSLKLELYLYGDFLVFIRSIPTLEDASLAVKEFDDIPDPGDEYPALELKNYES